MLNGEIKIDETYLFKEKKSSAPHHGYVNGSQWLFGLHQRNSTDFVVVPVQRRDKTALELSLLRHANTNSTIYPDCFPVYVSHRVMPKTSNLMESGYNHQYVNHKLELISALSARFIQIL